MFQLADFLLHPEWSFAFSIQKKVERTHLDRAGILLVPTCVFTELSLIWLFEEPWVAKSMAQAHRVLLFWPSYEQAPVVPNALSALSFSRCPARHFENEICSLLRAWWSLPFYFEIFVASHNGGRASRKRKLLWLFVKCNFHGCFAPMAIIRDTDETGW